MLIAASLTAVACQGGQATDSMPEGGFWSTGAVSDDEKLAVIQKVRAIDVCALLPRESLAALGQVSEVENVQPDQCRANIAVDGHPGGIAATWSVGTSYGVVEPTMGEPVVERAMGDVRVLYRDEPSTSADPQVRDSCDARAAFVSGADLMLSVRAPQDACATVEDLLRIALVQWRDEPAHGSSPDSDRTAITGADPCAVAAFLGTRVPVADHGIATCRLTVDGHEAIVTFGYGPERSVTSATPAFAAGPGQVYRSEGAQSDITSLTAIVGPALAASAADSLLGPQVPTVRVTTDAAVAEKIMREALALLP
ncbi:hypothetical protein BOX37_23085 [Nocardia mangyaensis]|uniref:Uncharacterized protein n=2 Tax=Nocardia mangyaensis TaxID=2213200 RepID=A0A1J0VWA0_9NOCA|nr:hypothetical protein BOX37_23085 [Nocardia mangyaensis]